MHFPKLTPLQARFAASSFALVVLAVIYFSLTPHHFAYAAELNLIPHEDHNHHRLPRTPAGLVEDVTDWEDDDTSIADGNVGVGQAGGLTEPELTALDHGLMGLEQEEDEKKKSKQPEPTSCPNNGPLIIDVTPNNTNAYVFPKDQVQGKHGEKGSGLPSRPPAWMDPFPSNEERSLELKKRDLELVEDGSTLEERQDSDKIRTVYITVNTCAQPQPQKGTGLSPPQPTLFVSMSSRNQNPGPHVDDDLQSEQVAIPFDEGYVSYALRTSEAVFFGVYGPSLQKQPFGGQWSAEIAASIDAPFHGYNAQTPFLFLVDSDSTSALLVTDNLTQASADSSLYREWLDVTPPFKMFAMNSNDSQTRGVQHSYCGLLNANSAAGIEMQGGITTRGLGNKPKEQFYLTGLNGSATYFGLLSMEGNSTANGGGVIGGGGQVWNAMNFTTKADNNCQIIFNLTFCSEVAYAVPSNPDLFPSTSELSSVYDKHAEKLYQNFTYSLQQIPCNTTSDAQYSLARNCTDCARDYKTWLCAVAMPRCEDFSSQAPWLQPRNVGATFANGSAADLGALPGPGPPGADGADGLVGVPGQGQKLLARVYANSSRNTLIDDKIRPGPYKEVLPCEDLCYSIVQSCPASFGFGCPLAGRGLERSYGKRSSDGRITCSYLGAVYYLNGADVIGRSAFRFAVGIAVVVGAWLVV